MTDAIKKINERIRINTHGGRESTRLPLFKWRRTANPVISGGFRRFLEGRQTDGCAGIDRCGLGPPTTSPAVDNLADNRQPVVVAALPLGVGVAAAYWPTWPSSQDPQPFAHARFANRIGRLLPFIRTIVPALRVFWLGD